MTLASEQVNAEFRVPGHLSDRRLDQVAADLFPEHSRSRIQSWIRNGELTVNGEVKRVKDRVHLDDLICIRAAVEAQVTWVGEDITLDICYEDEDILVINKPAGLVVHPAAGHADGTLVNALLHYAPELERIARAGIVHRLDKDTSGLMVVARSLRAHTSLVEQLQLRTMGREYEAVVVGTLTGGGTVNAPIGRHPQQRVKMAVVKDGKPAVTHYRVLTRFPAHTHVRCILETGRTHQIRVHMAHIRHPLVGDPLYTGRLRLPAGTDEDLRQCLRAFSRQALHARKLSLIHPATGKPMSWEVDLPDDMRSLLAQLAASARAF